jgi:ribosomal protein S18 acetylase RimI-like enzyme
MLVWPTLSMNLKFRNARIDDISGIARLLCDTFDSISAWNLVGRKLAEDGYKQQLRGRMEELVWGGAQHAMIVACDSDNAEALAGFMELGTMPSAVPVIQTWEGEKTETYPETPYLGNLAVADEYRRKKIGSRLVKLACKAAEKWTTESEDPSIFLAVDFDNLPAIRMYGELGFDIIADESQEIMRRNDRKPRLFFRKKTAGFS